MELADIKKARERIAGTLLNTPIVPCTLPNNQLLWLKFEQLHTTGSFKERGALNKIRKIKEETKAHGVIGASAGNHAQAVAYHAKREGLSVSMIMPLYTPTVKYNATKKWGASIELEGTTVDECMTIAKKRSKDENLVFIHPFDDPDIIAGQGTAGLEIAQDRPETDCVMIPVGGGGLASGVAVAIKSLLPGCKVIGVQTEKYPQVLNAFYGRPPMLEEKPVIPTIADGIAVKGIGEHSVPILRQYMDEMVTVSDEDIADAIFFLLQHKKLLSEGGGAAAVAAALSGKVKLDTFKNPCAIVSGGNIDMNLLNRIIEKEFLKQKRLLKVNVIISDRPGSLYKLTGLLKDLNVNILQIEHDRVSTEVPFYNTGTNLLLETRDVDHYNLIIQELKKHAYEVRIRH